MSDLIQNKWSEDAPYCIYKHTSPSGKVYIGQTCRKNLQKRFLYMGIGYKDCPYFWNAIQKYGWNNIKHEILAEGLTKQQADKYEKNLIKQYKDLGISYNVTDGGDGSKGTSFNTNKIPIYKDEIIKRIDKEILKEYLSLGWSIGYPQSIKNKISSTHKFKLCKNTLGKKSIYKGTLNKKVKPEELEKYLSDGWELGVSPNLKEKIRNSVNLTISKKDQCIWIHNEKEYKLIQKYELSEYLAKGWVLGMGNLVKSVKGYRWIHKKNKQLRVPQSKIKEYLNKGWEIGQK